MGREREGDGGRKSKDRKIKERRMLIEFLGKRGWCIFNGSVRGDEGGEYTFTGGRGIQ